MGIEGIITKLRNSDPNPEWWLQHVPKTSHWTDLNITRFLMLYIKYSNLWDPNNRKYYDWTLRLKSYRSIAKKLKLQNVDEYELMKLVEYLKERYLREQKNMPTVLDYSCNNYCPPWFGIIDKIVQRVMCPPERKEPSTESYEVCKDCCGKQKLHPPCEYYEAFQECKECCGKQGLKAPCVYFESSESSDNSFKDCQDCCGKQNLEAPCQRYQSSQESCNVKDDKIYECEVGDEKFKCYTIPGDDDDDKEEKILLINIEACPSESDHGEDDEDCFCLNSNGSSSSCSDQTPCSCADSNGSAVSDADVNPDCLQNCLGLLTALLNAAEGNDVVEPSCNEVEQKESEESTSICDEKCGCVNENQKTGLFIDSSRFRGKSINLLVDYIRDDFFGTKQMMKSRRHMPKCDCDPIYPLQLDL